MVVKIHHELLLGGCAFGEQDNKSFPVWPSTTRVIWPRGDNHPNSMLQMDITGGRLSPQQLIDYNYYIVKVLSCSQNYL